MSNFEGTYRPLIVNPERVYDISGFTEYQLATEFNIEEYRVDDEGNERDPGNTDGIYIGDYYDDDGKWKGPDCDGVALVYVREAKKA